MEKLINNEHLSNIKFAADCAIKEPDSIYSQEFFMLLDETFGSKGDYESPTQAVAVAWLINRANELEQENIQLKQGCENNPLVHEMLDWRERAEAAEAKLAELEKQRNPDYFLNRIESSDKWGHEVELRTYESQLEASKSKDDHGGGIIELFTRPAPAINLAEMVPDEMTWNRAHSLLDINQCGEDRYSAFMMGANYNRSAILRNIEEVK